VGELAASNTTGAVGSAHLTPHHTEPGAVLLGLGAVHVHDTLAEVKFQVSSGVDTLDFDQAGVVLLLGQSPPVSSHDALNIQARASLGALPRSGLLDLLLASGEELLDVHCWCLGLGPHLWRQYRGESCCGLHCKGVTLRLCHRWPSVGTRTKGHYANDSRSELSMQHAVALQTDTNNVDGREISRLSCVETSTAHTSTLETGVLSEAMCTEICGVLVC